MVDRVSELAKVHQVLGDHPSSVRVPVRPAPKQFAERLHQRARAVAAALIDRRTPNPEVTDALDAQLDEHILDPNRRAIAARTVALERWLADHGFRAGTPIHMLRGHRVLHHHGHALELPTARPVHRASYQAADQLLTTRVLDGLARRRPQSDQSGRVSVLPGFILLELAAAEFDEQFGLTQGGTPRYGHAAIGTLPVGPVIVATRDTAGDMLAHLLAGEFAHELAALGRYQHHHPVPTPGELLHNPSRLHHVEPRLLTPASLDHAAEQLVSHRLRHLASACRLPATATLSELGFTAHDWVPLATAHHHDGPERSVAVLHLAAILLGRALLAAFDDHAEARDELTLYPSVGLTELDCDQPWHRHVTAYDQYQSFLLLAHELGPVALDELYRRLVDPKLDFSHQYTTPHTVRLHLYPAPLHPIV